MATRMTSARFVGRTAELAELRAAFDEATASRPSLALVSGESGVGKSRLGDGEAAGAAQSRVFEALLALLDSLSDGGPVLLVIEDLHWADSSTRSFIGFLS